MCASGSLAAARSSVPGRGRLFQGAIGYTSYIEVLDAERSLFNVEVSQAQTQNAVYASLVNLYKAMGGGWVTRAERMVPKDVAHVPP